MTERRGRRKRRRPRSSQPEPPAREQVPEPVQETLQKRKNKVHVIEAGFGKAYEQPLADILDEITKPNSMIFTDFAPDLIKGGEIVPDQFVGSAKVLLKTAIEKESTLAALGYRGASAIQNLIVPLEAKEEEIRGKNLGFKVKAAAMQSIPNLSEESRAYLHAAVEHEEESILTDRIIKGLEEARHKGPIVVVVRTGRGQSMAHFLRDKFESVELNRDASNIIRGFFEDQTKEQLHQGNQKRLTQKVTEQILAQSMESLGYDAYDEDHLEENPKDFKHISRVYNEIDPETNYFASEDAFEEVSDQDKVNEQEYRAKIRKAYMPLRSNRIPSWKGGVLRNLLGKK